MVLQKLLIEEGLKRGLKESQKYSVSVLGYDFIGLVSRLLIFYFVAFIINAYFIASIKGGIWLNSLAVLLGSNPFPQTLPQWLIDLFTVGLGSSKFDQSLRLRELSERFTSRENPPGWDKPYHFGSFDHQLELGEITQEEYDTLTKGNVPTRTLTITFWQLIQIVSILIIVVEALQYDKMLKEKGQKPNITTLSVFSLIGIGISLMTFPQIIQKIKESRIITNV